MVIREFVVDLTDKLEDGDNELLVRNEYHLQTAAGIRAQAFTAMCGLPLPARLISYIMERIFHRKTWKNLGSIYGYRIYR